MAIEYIDSSHVYVVDGLLTPSVTQIVSEILPDLYSNIPKRILQRKAEYGNRVHELIENYGMNNEIPQDFNFKSYEGLSLKRFMELKEKHDIKFVSTEQPIKYTHNGNPLYAGRYDVIGTVNGEIAVIDIKTTEKLHTDALELQLSMYAMALEQMDTALKISKAYCLWLPKKGLGKLVEVNLKEDKKELLEKVILANKEYLARFG